QKAFCHASLNNTDEALKALTMLKDTALPGSLGRAQATYWSARLRIYSDLLTKNANKDQKKAREELKNLALDPNPTLYSWLAYKLLDQLKAKPLLGKRAVRTKKKAPLTPNASLPFIDDLVKQGFKREALALLNEEPLLSADSAKIKAIADHYIA